MPWQHSSRSPSLWTGRPMRNSGVQVAESVKPHKPARPLNCLSNRAALSPHQVNLYNGLAKPKSKTGLAGKDMRYSEKTEVFKLHCSERRCLALLLCLLCLLLLLLLLYWLCLHQLLLSSRLRNFYLDACMLLSCSVCCACCC